MPKVLIVEGQMKQYRVPFFTMLHDLLQQDGINLKVAYSEPSPSEAAKKDNVDLPSNFSVRGKGHWFFHGKFLYQPFWQEAKRADLVIVDHGNKYVLNHFLYFLQITGLKRVCFWGLGTNKQVDRSKISEWYKAKTIKRVNRYFAYTAGVGAEIASMGLPQERITVVQNAIDTREFQDYITSIENSDLYNLRKNLGINAGAPVGLFCGMLDPVKDIPFLIECAARVKRTVPEFHLILVGGGSQQRKVQDLIKNFPWVHAVGPKFGRDKALFFKLSDVLMLPGRVGLVILDAFAAGLPLVTVKLSIHGPEMEYLEDGVNGFKVNKNLEDYANMVISIFKDKNLLSKLKAGAVESSKKYNIDAMVENFRRGVIASLST